jgi:hypothetical protein
MLNEQELPSWALGRIDSAEQARAVLDRLASWAIERGVQAPALPQEPQTCCGRGCQGCVWIAYFEAVHHWRERTLLALGMGANDQE